MELPGINKQLGSRQRQSLQIINIEAAFSLASVVLAGGAFITGLALHFGASDFEIAVLAAIPFIAQIFQVISAYFIDTTGRRKLLTVLSLLISRIVLIGIASLALLQGEWRLAALLALFALNYVTFMTGAAGAISWFADLVQERIRGRFFASRNTAIAISTLVAVMIGGVIIDQFTKHGYEEYGYFILFILAGITGLVSVYLLWKLKDVPVQTRRDFYSIKYFFEPLRDKSYVKILLVFISWNFAVGVSAPFFTPQMLKNLKMSFTLVALYSAGGAIMAVFFNRLWGKAIDRFGCKPVSIITAFGISIIPFIWFFPRPDALSILIFESLYSGIFWAGFNLSAFNFPIALSPLKKRTLYIAIFSVTTGLALFIGSLLAGLLAEEWKTVSISWGQQTIINYHLIFALSGILRLLSALFMLSFREPNQKQETEVLYYMGNSIVRWISQGRQVFDMFIKGFDSIFIGKRDTD